MNHFIFRYFIGLISLFSLWPATAAKLTTMPAHNLKLNSNLFQPFRNVNFVPVHKTAVKVDLSFETPSFEGKVFVRDSLGALRFKPHPSLEHKTARGRAFQSAEIQSADIYLQDGSETSIAVNYDNDDNLVACYNTAWDFDPDIPHSNSTDGNLTWISRTFPNGVDDYTGYPFDPWVIAGNTAGEFYSTEIRHSAFADLTRCIISKSTDGGGSFSLFYENVPQGLAEDVFQDREMVDVDRTTLRGGGSGTTHDDKVYLCNDEWASGAFTNYLGSYLQVVSPSGTALTKIKLSDPSSGFNGLQFQPVAGIVDGTVYLLSRSLSFDGNNGNVTAYFHEITNGGAGPNTFSKSSISWVHTGQRFGTSGRAGVNGHRIDRNGYLDIDRSAGSRRGHLYYVYNPNPNPDDSAQDQGDVGIAVSTNGATSWSTALLPTAAGKTQYFPMLDVDEEGWIHVAYYQNDTGFTNGGVLNASTANLYYTFSYNGGISWSSPVQVNSPANALDYEDPPPDRFFNSYYAIGDYQQLKAVNTDTTKKVYILWSQYDKDRNYAFVGDSRDRVYCTTIEYSFNAIAPTISLISPNGGEIWPTGSVQTIIWSAVDNDSIDHIELRLDRGNDGTYEELLSIVSGNPGLFQWTVSGPLALQAKMQAIAHDTSGNLDTDESDSPFLIGCLAKPGDVNASGGTPNLQDVIYLVNFVFDKSRVTPPCNGSDPGNCWTFAPICRGDVNGSGGTPNLQDVIYLVNFVFDKSRTSPPCNGTDPGNCWTPVSSGACCLPVP